MANGVVDEAMANGADVAKVSTDKSLHNSNSDSTQVSEAVAGLETGSIVDADVEDEAEVCNLHFIITDLRSHRFHR